MDELYMKQSSPIKIKKQPCGGLQYSGTNSNTIPISFSNSIVYVPYLKVEYRYNEFTSVKCRYG